MCSPSAVNGIAQWMTFGSVSAQWMLVTRRSPTSQPLAGALRALTRKPPSTLVAAPFEADPVGRAGRDRDGAGRDFAQERFGVDAVLVAPHLRGDEVRVHREGDRDSRIARAEHAQDLAHLGVRRADATECRWHKGGGHTGATEPFEGCDVELAGSIGVGCCRPQIVGDLRDFIEQLIGGGGGGGGVHRWLSWLERTDDVAARRVQRLDCPGTGSVPISDRGCAPSGLDRIEYFPASLSAVSSSSRSTHGDEGTGQGPLVGSEHEGRSGENGDRRRGASIRCRFGSCAPASRTHHAAAWTASAIWLS